MMTVRKMLSNQRGESKTMTIGLAIAGILAIFLFWKLGIPLFKYMLFANFAQKMVDYDAENRKLDATLLQSIYQKVYQKAETLKLPLDERDLAVDLEEDRAIISAKYVYKVDLIVYQFDWKFEFKKISEGLGISPY